MLCMYPLISEVISLLLLLYVILRDEIITLGSDLHPDAAAAVKYKSKKGQRNLRGDYYYCT